MLNTDSGKCHAVNFFWGAGTPSYRCDQDQGGPKIPSMARRFRLALKVLSSNVRTDIDRVAGLMKGTKNLRRQDESSLPIYQPLPRE